MRRPSGENRGLQVKAQLVDEGRGHSFAIDGDEVT